MMLSVNKLTVAFAGKATFAPVLEDLWLELGSGETVALVGESGAGKSVFIEAVLRLLPTSCRVTGEIHYQGHNLLALPQSEFRRFLGRELAWVPQSASGALHPMLPIGLQLMEPLLARGMKRQAAWAEIEPLLESLDLKPARQVAQSYPHQLSGGMRQRALVAAALAQKPKVLLVDEPTKGVDTERRQQVIALFQEAKQLQPELSVVVVSHDLDLVEALADRVVVLYAGQLVEATGRQAFFSEPRHPFAKALLAALPKNGLEALPWAESRSVTGCRFHPRCPKALERCQSDEPQVTLHEHTHVRCWLYAN